MSTSVAKDLIHDLVGTVAIRRPRMKLVMMEATEDLSTYHAV